VEDFIQSNTQLELSINRNYIKSSTRLTLTILWQSILRSLRQISLSGLTSIWLSILHQSLTLGESGADRISLHTLLDRLSWPGLSW